MWFVVEYQVDLGFVLVKVEFYLLICCHVLEDLLDENGLVNGNGSVE